MYEANLEKLIIISIPHGLIVNEFTLVEMAAWKSADLRVHAILSVEHYFLDGLGPEQSFKQTQTIVGLSSRRRESRSGKLVLITNEDDFLGLVLHWDERAELDTLAGLVNNEVLD